MRILVTGGAGFIGSHVVDAVLHDGHEVAVIDNLSTGLAQNLNYQARFYHIDICDADAVHAAFTEFRPEIVVHHAAQIDVRKSTETPVFDAQVNILGSLVLLQNAVRHGVEKIVYASTGGAIYGEPDYLPADEKHPVRPIAEYGVSKHTVEHYLHAYQVNYDLRYTILRYANVYGPRQNVHGEAGVIAIFTGKMSMGETPVIFGDGQAVRDYVYVEDVARANVMALTAGEQQAINIGTATGTSVNTLYRLLAEATHYTAPPIYAPARIGEIQQTYLDNGLAHDILGWSPQVGIQEGIQQTVEYARVYA